MSHETQRNPESLSADSAAPAAPGQTPISLSRGARVGHGTLLLTTFVAASLAMAGVSAAPAGRAVAVKEARGETAGVRTAAVTGHAARDRQQRAVERAAERRVGRAARAAERAAIAEQQGDRTGFRPAWERATSPALVSPLHQEARIESYFEGGDRLKLARLRAWTTDRERIPVLGLEADPRGFDRARDDAQDLFKELARDYLRHELGVDAWTESMKTRWRSRRGGGERRAAAASRPSGPGFDVGPRVRLSDDPEIGFEVEGEGHEVLSRLRLSVDQALASGVTEARLTFDGGASHYELTLINDDPRLGDAVGVGVRVRF